jgi:hypothetical protein
MHEHYSIPNTSNICSRELDGPEYNDPNFYPEFQQKIQWFQNILNDKFKNNEAFVVLRVFDGEFYFLNCQKVGNVGIRHCHRIITPEFANMFKNGCYKVDILSTQLYADKLIEYNSIFPDKPFDLPMEIIYGLFANKWFFQQFKNEIGIIGGEHKINIIKELMKHEKYRNYLGIDYFSDYISVSERGTANNPDELINIIGQQLQNSKSKVFLFGIGIGKMAVAYKFPEYKNAIYIDVGCGISALAGTTAIERPYFGSWTNFRLSYWDYSNMDPIDYKDTAGKNEIII